MASKKERLDVLLVQKGFFSSREKAKASIMAGEVYVDGKKIEKAGEFVNIDSSTGGFTDCLLKHGAIRVYAVDVGYGQLDWSLRNDPRVINMEKTNIRFLKTLPEIVDIITIDVSFISLELVIPSADKFLKSEGDLIALIKPQFEAGREKVGKKGVVKDPAVHKEVIEKIVTLFQKYNYGIIGITYSPIKGAEGNIEYLICGKKEIKNQFNFDIAKIIEEAFKTLNK
jgi:23S rRNA (cytidine1920-2'-O)/16S rRNA (cytidine1409-2'-O)-methyltransferase